MKEQLTPWFPADVKPARKGIYIATVKTNERFYRYWDGVAWHNGGHTVAHADAHKGAHWWNQQAIHWRGLAKDPS